MCWKEEQLKGVVSCTEERRGLCEEEPKRWTTCSLGLVNSSSSIDMLPIISAAVFTPMTGPSLFIILRAFSAPSVVSLSSIAWLLSRSTFCSFCLCPPRKKPRKTKTFFFFPSTKHKTQHNKKNKNKMGKYAQIVMGPAGSGKVRENCTTTRIEKVKKGLTKEEQSNKKVDLLQDHQGAHGCVGKNCPPRQL